ncbi:MAG: hypothetical protein M1839_003631 [Geoglossum umbratile]|nr:MAG: hypothetical protein M1839_003631 [Geoglossum umbratile]
MAGVAACLRRAAPRPVRILRGTHWHGARAPPPGCRRQHQISITAGAKRLTIGVDGNLRQFDYAFLRDACTCPQCVDPSTRQKLFQTSDIPLAIKASNVKFTAEGSLAIRWENDVPGYGRAHVSEITPQFLKTYDCLRHRIRSRHNDQRQVLWDRSIMEADVKWIEYEEYMADDVEFFGALLHLSRYGLVFLKGVPDSEQSVEKIGNRIGSLRDTFYGRTWDVKSVLNAKNVAYTPQNLGLHMDLLYFANPPTIQLLHCLRNSVTGGSSVFSDSFHAATRIQLGTPNLFSNLTTFPVTFHYQNAGEHYHYTRPTVELEEYSYRTIRRILNVNWSPPFQAPFEAEIESPRLRAYLSSAKAFSKFVEAPESQFELTLKLGECVIFNNRRVLHARRAFDPSSGERWLKGAYVDGDPFRSRLRVLSERYSRLANEVDAGE